MESKSIYTRHARYIVTTMDCPVCGQAGGKKWATCLKREAVYLPEIPELIAQYTACPRCKVVYASNAITGFDFYADPPELDPRISRIKTAKTDNSLPLRQRFDLGRIQANYGSRSGFSLLDVGCADGEFLELASSQGIHCAAVETNPHLAALARERTGVTVYEGDMSKISVSEEYDVVCCTEVIEHILHPHPFVQSTHNALRPGGMLHLTTQPNTASLRSRFLKGRNDMIRNVFSHHVLYNPSAMRYLLRNHGFRKIRFHHYSRSGHPLGIRVLMRFVNLFGYFDDQVIVTAWKQE